MAKNPFDKYDAPNANPFDKFDAEEIPSEPTPQAQPPMPAEEPIDEPLVQKIMDSGASVGSPVSREEAVERAKRMSRLLKSSPETPILKDTGERPDTIGQGLGAAAEGILSGITFGIGTDMLGSLMDIIGFEELGTAAQARRREYFPTISEVSDIGAGIAQGGAGLLKSVAPKLVARGMQTTLAGKGGAAVVRGLAASDLLATGLRASQTKVAGKQLGRALEAEAATAARQGKITIDAKKAAGEALTAAETEIDDVLTKGLQTTLGDKAEELARIPLSKLTKGRVARKTTAEIAEDATLNARQQFLIDEIVKRDLPMLGTPATRIAYAAGRIGESTATGAGLGAAAGLLRGASTGFREAQMTKNDGDLFAEDISKKMWIGAKEKAREGAFIGTAIGFGIPTTAKGATLALNVGAKALSALTKAIVPRAGSILTGVRPERLGEFITMKDIAASTGLDYNKLRDDVERAFQFQHDYGNTLINDIDSIMASQQPLTPAEAAELATIKGDFVSAIADMRTNFMKRVGGNWKLDTKKIDEFYEGARFTGDKKELMPPPFAALEDALLKYQQKAEDFTSAYAAANPSAGVFNPAEQARINLLAGQNLRVQPRVDSPTALLVPDEPLIPYTNQDMALFPNMETTPTSLIYTHLPNIMERQLAPQMQGQFPSLAAIGAGVIGATKGFGATGILGSAAATKALGDLFLNPKGLIDNYGKVQRTIVSLHDGSRLFADAIGRRGTAQSVAIKTLTEKRAGTPLAIMAGVPTKEGVDPAKYSAALGNQLYEEDKELFKQLADIGDLTETFGSDYDLIDDSFPELAKAVAKTTPRQAVYLKKKFSALGDKPSEQQKYKYGIASLYTRNPDIIYDDIVRKRYVADEALEVLREVYPARLFQMQKDLYGAVLEAKQNNEKIDARQQLIVKKILGVPAFDMSPADLKRNQDAIQLPTRGGGGFSSKLPQLESEGLPR